MYEMVEILDQRMECISIDKHVRIVIFLKRGWFHT